MSDDIDFAALLGKAFNSSHMHLQDRVLAGADTVPEAISMSYGVSIAMNDVVQAMEKVLGDKFDKDAFVSHMTNGDITKWPEEAGQYSFDADKKETKKHEYKTEGNKGEIVYPDAFKKLH